MNDSYYNLVKKDKTASLRITGRIVTKDWDGKDTTSLKIAQDLEEIKDVEQIDVYINSLGGSIQEGVAIYNMLVNHPAKIITHAESVVGSIASVIYMAGDERIMPQLSMLCIHNPYTIVEGNALDLRKEADTLDKYCNMTKQAYLNKINITEKELQEMLDKTTYLGPQESLDKGFCTAITKLNKITGVNQSIEEDMYNRLCNTYPVQEDKKINKIPNKVKNDKQKEETEKNVSFFDKFMEGINNGKI